MRNYYAGQPEIWFGDGSSGASATSFWRSFRHNAAPLTYQWRKDGVPLAGATGASLTFDSFKALDAGNYDVVVSGFGSVTSAVATLSLSTPAAVPSPAGLVSWWPGDGNFLDRAGTNNGTGMGGVGFAPGMVGQAFNFNGHGAVIVADSPSLRFGTSDLTVEAWIQTSNADGYILMKEAFTVYPYPSLRFALEAGKAYFAVTDCGTGGCGFGTPGKLPVRSPNRVDDGLPHHVAGVRTAAGLQLFVDGTQVANLSQAPLNADNSDPMFIGAETFWNGSFPNPYQGIVDELALYNRALPPSEIAAIYAAGSAGKGKSPLFTAYLQNQTVAWGSVVRWCATATGSEPLSYQWQFNGADISGATANCLTVSNANLATAGLYSLLVTNPFGAITAQAGLSLLDLKMFPGLVIAGPTGNYRIEAMDSLGAANAWTILGTNFVTKEQMPFYYFDTNAPSNPKRFYRSTWAP